MSSPLTHESQRIVLELHRALSDIDPARWRSEAADKARAKLRAVRERMGTLTARRWPETGARLRSELVAMQSSLDAQIPDEHGTAANHRARWMAFRDNMMPAYEALQLSLRELEIHVPTLRPTNTRRSIMHALGGLSAIAILYVLQDSNGAAFIAVPLAVFGWGLEICRRRSVRFNEWLMARLGPVAHPHEWHRINSATWYCSALAILSTTFHPLASAIGLAALGVGDPLASTVGRRFGKRRLVHGRSVEGTSAFVVSVCVLGVAVCRTFAPELSWTLCGVLAFAGACSGALAELFSLRIDDNFSVPIFSAGVVTIVASTLGLM